MTEHDFCRALLKRTMTEVREHTTTEQRKGAWTYNYGRGYMEFQLPACEGARFPTNFYWYGQACCGWHARVQGWNAWMRERGIE